MHRRSRAVTRLAAAIRAGKLTGQTIQHYIIPVLWPLLQQQTADKGLSGRMVGGQGIVDAAVDCLGACAGVMGWRACVHHHLHQIWFCLQKRSSPYEQTTSTTLHCVRFNADATGTAVCCLAA